MSKSYKEIMPQISTFIFDVDGVLTNGIVHISTTGELTRAMNIKDGYALKTAIDLGYNICIISGGANEGVRKRLEGLGINDIYLGVHNKMFQFKEYLEIKNISPSEILYMGDEHFDMPLLKKAGFSATVKNASYEVMDVVDYVTETEAGMGCAREVMDILRVVHDIKVSVEYFND